jgi:hypothetical protein
LAEHVNPLRDSLQEMRDDVELARLQEDFPVLATEEGANELFQMAGAVADSQRWGPEIAHNAAFLRILAGAAMWERSVAEERQQDSDPGSIPGAQLERPGGAGPLPSGPDVARGIVEAGGRRGASVLF